MEDNSPTLPQENENDFIEELLKSKQELLESYKQRINGYEQTIKEKDEQIEGLRAENKDLKNRLYTMIDEVIRTKSITINNNNFYNSKFGGGFSGKDHSGDTINQNTSGNGDNIGGDSNQTNNQ